MAIKIQPTACLGRAGSHSSVIDSAGSPSTHGRAPTLAEASRFWLRLGLVSFGGAAG